MKYILGGGLSGLIAGYYNPEYTVLTYDFGGFVDTKFGRAFVVLHETDPMLELFDELNVDSFVKEIKIGYYDTLFGGQDEPGYVKRELEHEGDFARRYVERKLPPEFQPGKDLELSAPGNEWRALFVDSSIVRALKSEVENIKTGMIKSIGEDEITLVPSIGSDEHLEYDEIVSTMPAPVFDGMVEADTGWALDHHPTTYAEIETIPDRYRGHPWNILYTVDKRVPFHRVVRNMLSSNYFVECLGKDLSPPIEELPGFVDSTTNDLGVIADEDLDPPYSNIRFLGRYAEWDHTVRIDHVVERARNEP